MLSFSNSEVEDKFNTYPAHVRERMFEFRSLVFAVASNHKDVGKIEECLKWGEPSYKTKNGSTLRMDWKDRNPDHFALYFSCSTTLVETFKKVFNTGLTFEGKRAVLLKLNEPIPTDKIASYIEKALTYKLIKDLPYLGYTI